MPATATAPSRVNRHADPRSTRPRASSGSAEPWSARRQITSFKPLYFSATQFAASGTELFTGCLDSNRSGACDAGEPNGTLRFTATFWGETNPTTKKEIRGGCYHQVAGGTGGFAGAKGVIAMLDTPAGATVKTTYRGELQLAGAATSHAPMRATQGVRQAASSAGC